MSTYGTVYRASGFGKLKLKIIMSKVTTFFQLFPFQKLQYFGAIALHLGCEDPLPSLKVLDQRTHWYLVSFVCQGTVHW
jgi:hypothetical protein